MRPLVKPSRYVGLCRRLNAGALLRLGPEPLEFAWLCPARGESVVGIGVAGGIGEISWADESVPADLPGPFFGGLAFDAQRAWGGFESERWILPEVLAWWTGRDVRCAVFAPEGTPVADLEARLSRVSEQEPLLTQAQARVVDSDRSAWNVAVETALQSSLTKVVLARELLVETESVFSERAILKSLEARNPQAQTFLFRGRDGSAFVGSSPETLLKIAQGEFETVALAGTAPLGRENDLLASEKDQREHQLVVAGIQQAILPYVSVMDTKAQEIRATREVAHLCTPIRGTLKPGVDVMDVARALHPTAAVCGAPREAAMQWLREHEGFSRGWYAGAVGWRNASALHLCVAIRSARIDGNSARVFAGAGLVQGSEAQSEWEETARKSQTMLNVLGVAHE